MTTPNRPFKGYLLPPQPDIFAFVRSSALDRPQRGAVANISRLVVGESLHLHGPCRVHDLWLILLDKPSQPIAVLTAEELVAGCVGLPEGTDFRDGDVHLPPGGVWALPVVALASILDGKHEAAAPLPVVEADLGKIQASIGEWQTATFGSDATSWPGILRHAQKEGM